MNDAAEDFVTSDDVKKMIDALSAHRASEWWVRTENPEPESRCLSPLVLQNMKLGYESGTISPTMNQFKNLVATAIYYQQKCAALTREAEDKLAASASD